MVLRWVCDSLVVTNTRGDSEACNDSMLASPSKCRWRQQAPEHDLWLRHDPKVAGHGAARDVDVMSHCGAKLASLGRIHAYGDRERNDVRLHAEAPSEEGGHFVHRILNHLLKPVCEVVVSSPVRLG